MTVMFLSYFWMVGGDERAHYLNQIAVFRNCIMEDWSGDLNGYLAFHGQKCPMLLMLMAEGINKILTGGLINKHNESSILFGFSGVFSNEKSLFRAMLSNAIKLAEIDFRPPQKVSN